MEKEMQAQCPFCSKVNDTQENSKGVYKLLCEHCGRMYLIEISIYLKIFKSCKTYII